MAQGIDPFISKLFGVLHGTDPQGIDDDGKYSFILLHPVLPLSFLPALPVCWSPGGPLPDG